MKLKYTLLMVLLVSSVQLKAQIDEDKLGAWYMYFFDTQSKKSQFGIQGDVQFRNWDYGSDLEQVLLRTGLTYKPKNADIKFTLGLASITNGTYGASTDTKPEFRVYQEALFPVKFGKRFYTKHRFRYEQRYIKYQSLKTRYRYNFFLNVPLNKTELVKNAVYLAFYNELFINGERSPDVGPIVEVFDRNRLYLGLGFVIKKNMSVQFAIMDQSTNTWSKNQLQLSFHHKF